MLEVAKLLARYFAWLLLAAAIATLLARLAPANPLPETLAATLVLGGMALVLLFATADRN